MSIRLNNSEARHIILALQGLAGNPNRRMSRDALQELIVRLGFVQVDSIQWVERAQHMILFARNQTYRPAMLKRLVERDRLLFENWTHDASIIPSRFWPYWLHRFERRQEILGEKFSQWQGEGYADHCQAMLDRIAEGGPLRSRDLDKPSGEKLEMWQWHDGKAALEFLWRTGVLCIRAREGFQKVYDLAERVIPPEHYEASVSHDEFIDWSCRSAIERLGFGSAGDIARYWDHVSIAEAQAWAEDQGPNSLVRATVDCAEKGAERTLLARPDIGRLVRELTPLPSRIRALSPFDPVIRDRKRLEWLFGFNYRIEIYVPEDKRIWGYYVFPLLEGDRLIGRIDMRADRKTKTLRIRKLWLEPKIRFGSDRQARLQGELQRQARLCGAADVVWEAGSTDAGPDGNE